MSLRRSFPPPSITAAPGRSFEKHSLRRSFLPLKFRRRGMPFWGVSRNRFAFLYFFNLSVELLIRVDRWPRPFQTHATPSTVRSSLPWTDGWPTTPDMNLWTDSREAQSAGLRVSQYRDTHALPRGGSRKGGRGRGARGMGLTRPGGMGGGGHMKRVGMKRGRRWEEGIRSRGGGEGGEDATPVTLMRLNET